MALPHHRPVLVSAWTYRNGLPGSCASFKETVTARLPAEVMFSSACNVALPGELAMRTEAGFTGALKTTKCSKYSQDSTFSDRTSIRCNSRGPDRGVTDTEEAELPEGSCMMQAGHCDRQHVH